MTQTPSIVWFRSDLRLKDNPALSAAVKRGGAVIPVFIWAPHEEQPWPPGAASRWWLHHSLASLQDELQSLGSRLIVRAGDSYAELERLINETGAEAVFWNRRYEPAVVERDKDIKAALRSAELEAESFNASLLFEPWEVCTKQGGPFQVFTPFWNACCALPEPNKPLPAPKKILNPSKWPKSENLESLELLPRIQWDAGFYEAWQPGAVGALKSVNQFLKSMISDYRIERDRPDHRGTSRLSPHLHFGEIGPREVWHAVRTKCHFDGRTRAGESVQTFLKELGWREFAHHVLFHFPQTATRPLREQFERFPWRDDATALRAWQRGLTGYPIVDAGMRELWTTGWMHNRVRMIVGSFLTKDLRITWQEGARWFWETLVDADLANNTLGWQWVSGCGADAAPYFRVFNPVSQGEKFDPDGTYVRRWVPELKGLPDKWIQQPWQAPTDVLRNAKVTLDKDYPRPTVDHAEARVEALAAFRSVRSK